MSRWFRKRIEYGVLVSEPMFYSFQSDRTKNKKVLIFRDTEFASLQKELNHGGERLQFNPSLPKNNVFGNRGSGGDICDVTLACKG